MVLSGVTLLVNQFKVNFKRINVVINMEDILNAISTVGFPISMCGAFGYVLVVIIKKLLAQIDAFGTSLDKFNSTLISMDKRLEEIENDIKNK
jgi:hypothetical protein